MYYKVLIIDDNHSFIDSLKYSLEKYHFQYDTSFKFQGGLNKIEQNGALIKRDLLSQIDAFNNKVIELENSGAIIDENTLPELSFIPEDFSSVVDPNGYCLLIIEHDSENMMKGLDFILQMIKSFPSLQTDDFILLTHRFNEIKTQAGRFKVPCFDKRMTNEDFHAHIVKKIKLIGTQIEQSNEIYRLFDAYRKKYIKVIPESKAKKKSN